jgi:predicted phosphoribosyltransferase
MSDKVHEIRTLRDRTHAFKDRWDAGKILAQMLESEYAMAQDTMVFSIPAGGVPVGLEISKRLNLPFDCIIVRKATIPDNTEVGFGAVTLEGSIFLNQELLSHLKLTDFQIEQQIASVKKELEKRNALFRGGIPLPDLSGKTAILVDDGLASGYTMMASIHTLKNKGAQKIVVAVPTAPLSSIDKVQPLVDALYCANIRDTFYFAVADAYEHWYDLSQTEVIELLKSRGKLRQTESDSGV